MHLHLLMLVPILSAFVPDVSRLGAGDYFTREAETRRCDNPISAALLPNATDCPETNARIDWLKQRHREPSQLLIERRMMRDDFPRWVSQYLALNRSAIARDLDFFVTEVYWSCEHCRVLSEMLPPPPDQTWESWGPWGEVRYPGDFPVWLEYLDYHQGVAPRPREKGREP